MRYLISMVMVFILSSVSWGAPNFSAPVVVKQFQPINSTANSSRRQASSTTATSAVAISPNIIPIITLNDSVTNSGGISQHEPCAATRLTPTLVFTAAHCLVGGLKHGQRIEASLFKAQDGTEGLILSNPRNESVAKTNAQVFMYRPKWTNPATIPVPFDFAVVVLDPKLQFKMPSSIQAASLDRFPPTIFAPIKKQIDNRIQLEFAQQSIAYNNFMNKQLDAVALLTMSSIGVVPELQGRTLSAYFWNGYQFDSTRDRVHVLNQTIKGTGAPNNSHLLLFSGEGFHAGTSGSPVFDSQRKLVVSVASGVMGDGSNGGGLIDQTLCQWVKGHDSNAKCLVRNEAVAPIEHEN